MIGRAPSAGRRPARTRAEGLSAFGLDGLSAVKRTKSASGERSGARRGRGASERESGAEAQDSDDSPSRQQQQSAIPHSIASVLSEIAVHEKTVLTPNGPDELSPSDSDEPAPEEPDVLTKDSERPELIVEGKPGGSVL